MTAEPDQYFPSTLVGGLPTCTFPPKPYTRWVTSVVVSNTVASAVMGYRGTLNSVPVMRNSQGQSNTLTGKVKIPAGQQFFVQWSAVGSASARVSFSTDLNDDGDSGTWAEVPVPSITIPSDGPTSGNPYIVITGDTSLYGTTFASVAFYSPSLPPGWAIRCSIYESTSDVCNWNIELVDENFVAVEEPFSWSYDKNTNTMALTVGNDNITLPGGFKGTTVSAQNEVMLKCVQGTTFIDAGNVIAFEHVIQSLLGIAFGAAGDTTVIRKNDKALGFNVKNVNQNPPPADTETNAAFQLIAGASSLVYTKEYDDTDLAFEMTLAAFSAGAGGTRGSFGLRHAGGDIYIGSALYSAASTENAVTGFQQVSGLPAGNYTFQPIWRRDSGAGTLTITASDGNLSWRVSEVMEP